MASRFPLARFSITATATRNRAAYIIRRNFAAEAVTKDMAAKQEHAKSSSELWKKISLFVCPIALLASAGNALMIMKQHAQHHHEAPHDHPHFEYQKVRNKPFCWGDGDHTLFHNPAVNGP
uniref:Cytochrome c oxidase subunit n=1 Tax=Anthurium amnicola TaxID=1678845 RepID=A0A1D1ZCX4_9ARAE